MTKNSSSPSQSPDGDTPHSPQGGVSSADFEEFWKVFPRTKNSSKHKAFKAWCRLKTDGALRPLEQMILAAKGYAGFLKTEGVRRKEPHPIAHCSTWLNERRFDDLLEADDQSKAAALPTTHARDWADEIPQWASFKAKLSPQKWAVWFAQMRPNGSPTTLLAPSSFDASRVSIEYGTDLFAHFGREVEIKFQGNAP